MTALRHILRRRERTLMAGRCKVTRGSAATVIHPNLPCTVVPSGSVNRTVEVGGDEVTLHLYDVAVAHTADVQKDDVLEVLSSADAGMVGRYLTVLQVTHDEFLTNRRLVCEEMR